jgi:hypothetical protein
MTDQRVISCPIHPDESWYCPVCLENADLGIENERDYRLGRLRGRREGMIEAAGICCEQAERFMKVIPLEPQKPYACHECAAAIRELIK